MQSNIALIPVILCGIDTKSKRILMKFLNSI